MSTFNFVVDKENNKITINREFAAERPLVWDAYTKQEILEQWWAPNPWKARTKTMDFKTGGHWLYAMVGPNGEEHWSLTSYDEVRAPEMFKGLDAFTDADGNVIEAMPKSNWLVEFEEKGKNTMVNTEITFGDLAQLEGIIQMGFKEGMTMTMEQLDVLLTKLKQ